GGLQGLADLEAAEGLLLTGVPRGLLAELLAGGDLLVGGVLVGAVGDRPGAQRVRGGPVRAGAREGGTPALVRRKRGGGDPAGGGGIDLGQVEGAGAERGDPLVVGDGA